ncbi:MAG: hypothetical protein ABTQ26_13870 [Azonexus sp.]
MKYLCTAATDLEELIGHECTTENGSVFTYGPLPQAMLNDEELVLENSAALPVMMAAKLHALCISLFISEVAIRIQAGEHFRLLLH